MVLQHLSGRAASMISTPVVYLCENDAIGNRVKIFCTPHVVNNMDEFLANICGL